MLPPLRRTLAGIGLVAASCQSLPDQAYPWPGTIAVGVVPGAEYDWATSLHAYSMPDPEGWGTWFQFGIDPAELLYTLYGGLDDDDLEDEEPSFSNYSFSRKAATFGLGTGIARNLGDRVLVFAGAGWAMAFEHEYRRVWRRWGAEDEEHLHYLTSGLNLTGGLQYRLAPDIGLEVGYQSFYETWYVGLAFPF